MASGTLSTFRSNGVFTVKSYHKLLGAQEDLDNRGNVWNESGKQRFMREANFFYGEWLLIFCHLEMSFGAKFKRVIDYVLFAVMSKSLWLTCSSSAR